MKLVSLESSLFKKFELKNLSKILGGATGANEDSSSVEQTSEDSCHVEDDDCNCCYYSTNDKDACIA